MADPILSANELSCHFGGVKAVDGVSLDIAPGSSVGIIGPNGAGKTTLFNLISGFVRPNSGTVRFRGQPIEVGKAHRNARAGLGRTFQTVRVFDELSVTENMQVADLLSSVKGSGYFRDRKAESLKFVGMERFANHEAGSLSYGQKKLIELAMVLINRPVMILLDEPVAGVNPALVEQIADVLQNLRKSGQTVVVVEHNVPFVTGICEKIVVMANGQKLMEGSGAEMQKDERVLEAFLGG